MLFFFAVIRFPGRQPVAVTLAWNQLTGRCQEKSNQHGCLKHFDLLTTVILSKTSARVRICHTDCSLDSAIFTVTKREKIVVKLSVK
jgi:hypothetical protein